MQAPVKPPCAGLSTADFAAWTGSLRAHAAVVRGRSNEAIAERLIVSPATAKTPVSRVIGTLEARDRAQVVVLACESGLVQPGHASPEAMGGSAGGGALALSQTCSRG